MGYSRKYAQDREEQYSGAQARDSNGHSSPHVKGCSPVYAELRVPIPIDRLTLYYTGRPSRLGERSSPDGPNLRNSNLDFIKPTGSRYISWLLVEFVMCLDHKHQQSF